MVAPSYQKYPQSSPFDKNGKMYCFITKADGSLKEVRWYSVREYNKLYKTNIQEEGPDGSYERFGFNKNGGYVYVVGGEVLNQDNHDYLCGSPARYATMFGWYCINALDVPPTLKLIKLYYDKISKDMKLIDRAAIENYVKSIGGKPNII